MNLTLNGSHPSLWTCIEKLQDEQKRWEDELCRIRTGMGVKQTEKHKSLDDRLARIVNTYNSSMGTIDYFIAISTCIYDYQE